MFINADPRCVSNSFETFVHRQQAESLHQRLVEMTNNNINAWSVYHPDVPPVGESWDDRFDGFENGENYSVQGLYGQNFPSSQDDVQSTHFSKSSLNTHTNQDQSRGNISSLVYQESTSSMNCFGQPSPMFGQDYSQWSLGRERDSFSDFANIQNSYENFTLQQSIEPTSSAPMPAASFSSGSSYYSNESSQPMNSSGTSPDTVYSNYSPRSTTAFPQMNSSTMQTAQQMDTRAGWWPADSRTTKSHGQIPWNAFASHDVLPRFLDHQQQPRQQQQPYGPWTLPTSQNVKWESSMEATTISPKVLSLNISSSSAASSKSSQDSSLAMSNMGTSSTDTLDDLSQPEALAVVEPRLPIRWPRQLLPDSAPSGRRSLPVLVSNDTSNRSSRRRFAKTADSDRHARQCSSSSNIGHGSAQRSSSREAISRAPVHKKLEPKGTDSDVEANLLYGQSAVTIQAAHQRDAKDDFLVRSKLAGMSYKEIRRQGKFTEAESTLRGRFRTLTKHKAARVRKPEWNDNDIRLLKKAVKKLTPGDPSKCKVPWKLVAEYISNHGGSYHFGNATCRKRWDELQTSG